MSLYDCDLEKAFDASPKFELSRDGTDLVWELGLFQQWELAQEFILLLEGRLSVYSPSTAHLYSNYNVVFEREQCHRLMVLPNPFASHDTFFDIPPAAVKPTGIFMLPDYYAADRKACLRVPTKSGGFKFFPVAEGLRVINNLRPENQPLVPVITKGDLRETDDGSVCLHLHSLSVSNLEGLSAMDISAMRNGLIERLEGL